MNSSEKQASISREDQLRLWKEKRKEQKQSLEHTSAERRKRSIQSDVSVESTRSVGRRTTAQNTPFSDGSGKLNSKHSFQQETVAFRLKVQGKNVKDAVTTRSITPHPRARIQRDSVTASSSVGSGSSRGDRHDFKIPPLPDQRSRKHVQTRRNRRLPKILSVKAKLENISPLSTSFFSPPTHNPSQGRRSGILQGSNMSLKEDSFKTPTETRAIRKTDLPTTSSKRADSIANQTENTEDRLSRQFSTNVLIGRGPKTTEDHDWRLMASPDPSDFNTPFRPKDELQLIGGDHELVHDSECARSTDTVEPFTESEVLIPSKTKTSSELEGISPSQPCSDAEVRCVDPFIESQALNPPETKTESELEEIHPSQPSFAQVRFVDPFMESKYATLSETKAESSELEGVDGEDRCVDPFIESEVDIPSEETKSVPEIEVGISSSQPSSTADVRCPTEMVEASFPSKCPELPVVDCDSENELFRSSLDVESCSESESSVSDRDSLKFDLDNGSLRLITSRRSQRKKSRRQSNVYGALPTDEGVEKMVYSPASSSAEEDDNASLSSGGHTAAQTPRTSETGCLLVCDNMEKVGGKTVLEPVAETTNVACAPCPLCGDTNAMQRLKAQLGELLVSNQKLLTTQHKFREDYEKRVSPFRDLFEDVVKLRAANQKLKAENGTVNATLQSTIRNLQTQMAEALSIALSKKNELETKLKNAEATISLLTNSKETDEEDISMKGSDL